MRELSVLSSLAIGLWACAPSNATSVGPVTSSAGPASAPSAELVAEAGAVPSPPASGSSASAASAALTTAAPPPPHVGPLASFHDALRALERRERSQHVRIVWLGDSHAQADFWTGGVRSALQRRFGNAGPGFVHLGMDKYRHDDIEFQLQGSWRMRPKKPSSIEPWGDGAFGLGGVLNAGYAGTRVAGVRVKDTELSDKVLRWDLCYKPATERDRFDLAVGQATENIGATPADLGVLHHVERETRREHHLEVHIRDGGPDFCGVYVATDPAAASGVLVDNLGINGARYETALAWNEGAWSAELTRRPTDLFVFEYGGNEASDGVPRLKHYGETARALIARAKRAAPNASCLVVGPADRADRENQIPPIVDAVHRVADEAGCGFWDTWKAMGGKGSLARWRDQKKAAPDGVHLVPKGYAELAALLTESLLAGYRKD